MTIQRGLPWGEAAGPLPPDAPLATSDRELTQIVARARAAGEPVPPIGLLGGDLWRTLGGLADDRRIRSREAMHLPIDLGVATLEPSGEERLFSAHAVARSRGWRGPFAAAFNAEHLGAWKAAPRAHPNDGLLEVIQGELALDQRLKARRRLPTGAHLPHPGLRVERRAALTLSWARPRRLWVDGEAAGRVSGLRLRVEPDAFTVVV
ncbi:MAG: hypothetical protein ACKVWR_11980 [Acidimicrobiales bacterium]